MATTGVSSRYESSAGELSSPPSGSLSEPASPSGLKKSMDQGEIIVGSGGDQRQQQQQQQQPPPQPPPRQITFQQYPSPAAAAAGPNSGATPAGRSQPQKRYELIDGNWVQLTAAGVPRKKPGRKPGTVVKPKAASEAASDQPKPRKPRKPRDPNAPPAVRKRKLAPVSDLDTDGDAPRPAAPSASGPQTAGSGTSTPAASSHQQRESQPLSQRYSPKMPKRDGYPGSMQNILNADPPASSTVPVRSSGLSYDPIRGNYDPIRETIAAHGPSQFQSSSGSPRGPTQLAHRSPSIASMLEPQAATSPTKPHHLAGATHARLQANDSSSMPPSPSYRQASSTGPTPRQAAQDAKKEPTQDGNKDTPPPPPPPPPPAQRPVVNQAKFTTIANGPVRKVDKSHTGVSTPKTDNVEDLCQDSEGRSILDFGKAKPGEELQTPTIVLNVPLKIGETNKYVNFMRMAEERYGWDALHPRLAANRERKARIAAAAASLEKVDSSRESGDEMSVDLSDAEASNQENGGTSGPDAQAKPKKKRNFKEDQYDVDDDFVDDSELLWEAQAAASRDGFFVYSGPLVPEVERPPAGADGLPKRGRGSRGGRGGRAGARGGGAGRGGGPGSRGGAATRKPRATKSEKLQRDREKAERETVAQLSKTPTNPYALQPTTPSFTVSELGA
ncbi:hypothetical protein XA68_15665 [Ophiocordyceps unilateralis]|uniref:Hpc2-related domain-containing protein n=1 Tax=Ophiocordyceps unilateralis TaxID=268505 RepID=A0A2A9P825_OPHUN|nr:hypothetical protein XA68_15665 [Ophiocordyceps unilateralis]